MKKIISIFIFIIFMLPFGCFVPINSPKTKAMQTEQKKAYLAIVIDDFGEDRRGVSEMLAINRPLTIAVLPHMEYSVQDATAAHNLGHEVILHMPMENQSQMPESYYGPTRIKNSHTPAEAKQVFNEAFKSVPYAVGANNHMGTGVTQNEEIMTAILEEVKNSNAYFLDSRTIIGTVSDTVSKKVGARCYQRDFFLEPSGRPSYEAAKRELLKAAEHAQTHGYTIAIGHIGPVGTTETARAIKDSLELIEAMGVEIVPLSRLEPAGR